MDQPNSLLSAGQGEQTSDAALNERSSKDEATRSGDEAATGFARPATESSSDAVSGWSTWNSNDRDARGGPVAQNNGSSGASSSGMPSQVGNGFLGNNSSGWQSSMGLGVGVGESMGIPYIPGVAPPAVSPMPCWLAASTMFQRMGEEQFSQRPAMGGSSTVLMEASSLGVPGGWSNFMTDNQGQLNRGWMNGAGPGAVFPDGVFPSSSEPGGWVGSASFPASLSQAFLSSTYGMPLPPAVPTVPDPGGGGLYPVPRLPVAGNLIGYQAGGDATHPEGQSGHGSSFDTSFIGQGRLHGGLRPNSTLTQESAVLNNPGQDGDGDDEGGVPGAAASGALMHVGMNDREMSRTVGTINSVGRRRGSSGQLEDSDTVHFLDPPGSVASHYRSQSVLSGQSVETDSIGHHESEPERVHHAAPIFHPLPPLFSDPPRMLFPWLPTNAGRKDLPTVAVLHNCRLESRMVNEYADSHQEMSLMLALPGVSSMQAPMLTLQQAGSILRVINEPLSVLKVGRMSRKLLPNPAKLNPTEDVGTLTLWLSPNSDVRVIWHSMKHPTPDGEEPIEWQEIEPIGQLRPSEDGSPFRELFCYVEAAEELAWVAAESDRVEGGTGISLELIDQDPSGRSFRLVRRSSHNRQRQELATKLAAEKERSGGRVSRETAKLQALLRACNAEPDQEENLFFWIAESSLKKGKQVLKSMQSQLNRLPTLSEKSGVPEKKLREVANWFTEAEHATGLGTARQETSSFASWVGFGPGLSVPSHLFSMGNPANLLDWMARAQTQRNGSSSSRGSVSSGGGEENEHVSDASALSATANFLVSDRRWGLTHLSTATVTVAVGVESTGEVRDVEVAKRIANECAHEVAKRRAEAGARAEAERLGRRRLEELAAEKAVKRTKVNRSVDPSNLNVPDENTNPAFPFSLPRLPDLRPPQLRNLMLAGPGPSSLLSLPVPPGRNHWRHDQDPAVTQGFIPDNMYIGHGYANGIGGSSLPEDTHANLGLGFGSGPHAMRNGRATLLPDGREVRQSGGGYNYSQWQLDHANMLARLNNGQNHHRGVYGHPGWRPRVPQVPNISSIPRRPWGRYLRHPNYIRPPPQVITGVPGYNWYGHRPGQSYPMFYPRHLPPPLPMLDMLRGIPYGGRVRQQHPGQVAHVIPPLDQERLGSMGLRLDRAGVSGIERRGSGGGSGTAGGVGGGSRGANSRNDAEHRDSPKWDKGKSGMRRKKGRTRNLGGRSPWPDGA